MAPSAREDLFWSAASHCSWMVVLIIIGPLLILLMLGKRSPHVRYHAVEALNFQITFAIAVTAFGILTNVFFTPEETGLGLAIAVFAFVLGITVEIAATVLSIIAAVRSYRVQPYRYPLIPRLVK